VRVLLVQHSAANTDSYPLGLACVAGILQNAGHSVAFLDLALEEGDPVEILVRTAERERAAALGVTLMTPQYEEYLALAAGFRPRLPSVRVIAGGPHVSAVPEETLREGAVDIAVTAEAERMAAQLFEALEKGTDLGAVPGVAYLDGAARCQRTPDPALISNLDAAPAAPLELFRPDRYRGRLRGLRMANVQASRGCPFRCLYCLRGPASGRRFRPRGLDAVLSEIRRLHDDYGIRALSFVDDIFTFDMDRTARLCGMLRAEPYRLRWMCETRADRVDEALLATMKRAGCVSIDFGVESGSEMILERLRKRISKDMVRRAFRGCRKIGMPTRAFFMLGTPWETDETVEETIAFARELRPTVSVFFLAMPYPGTELREAFLEAGWPLPARYGGRGHYVEAGGFHSAERPGDPPNPHTRFIRACRHATRRAVWAQLSRPQYYPEVISGYLTRYSPGEFASRVARRGWRLLR
jgi:anaerobic magnesium-protoporphyrin IX monomethyl ester cyclase